METLGHNGQISNETKMFSLQIVIRWSVGLAIVQSLKSIDWRFLRFVRCAVVPQSQSGRLSIREKKVRRLDLDPNPNLLLSPIARDDAELHRHGEKKDWSLGKGRGRPVSFSRSSWRSAPGARLD